MELKLTESFVNPEESCLEVTATMLNVNHGKNRGLMEKSKTLRDYAFFIDRVRKNAKEMPLEEAVEQAVGQCITEGILEEYLTAHKAEVVGMLTKEYSETEIAEMFYEDGFDAGREEGYDAGRDAGREEGRKEGREEGREEGRLELLVSMVNDGTLTVKQAASKMGETEEVFTSRLEMIK